MNSEQRDGAHPLRVIVVGLIIEARFDWHRYKSTMVRFSKGDLQYDRVLA